MAEEKQLSLEEMVSLAEKVENWERSFPFPYRLRKNYGNSVCGSLEDIEIDIGHYPPSKLFSLTWNYSIKIKHKIKEIELGNLKINEKEEGGRMIEGAYDNALSKSIGNEGIERRNKQKEREDAFNYARSLLEN
ncbi:MAG: hypothetical protein KJ767_02550 [Nanoarchaeota archaeon]|nr:hypothetical protein [Nanoarchaeota archaeon]